VYVGAQPITPTSPIFLLVGEIGTLGVADLGEYWLACGHQTGSIITADVAEPDALAITAEEKLIASRLYAREMKVKGGR
jgi:hypothetical protein